MTMQVTHTNPLSYLYKSALPAKTEHSTPPKETPLYPTAEAGQERSGVNSESRTKIVSDNGIQISEVSVSHTYHRLSLRSSAVSPFKDNENSPVNGDVAVDTVGNQKTSEAANTILRFIENRLEKDLAEGASPEDIESRLQAGLEGFKKGFAEAKEKLDAMGLLDGEDNLINKTINGTYDSVLLGIESLRDKFLGGNGTIAQVDVMPEKNEATSNKLSEILNGPSNNSVLTNNFSTLTSHHHIEKVSSHRESVPNSLTKMPYLSGTESSTFQHLQGVQNSFSFQVETADGDKVTITARTNDVSLTRYSLFNTPLWENESFAKRNDKNSFFSISVDGDLDEEELKAIGDLVSQVENLSINFFEGDLDLAFNQASNLGYDANEIVGFSLNLKHIEIEKIRATYQEFLPVYNEQNKHVESLIDKLKPMGDFTKDLIDAAQIASKFSDSHLLIVKLASQFENQSSDGNGFSHRFSSFVARLLEDVVDA